MTSLSLFEDSAALNSGSVPLMAGAVLLRGYALRHLALLLSELAQVTAVAPIPSSRGWLDVSLQSMPAEESLGSTSAAVSGVDELPPQALSTSAALAVMAMADSDSFMRGG